MKQKVLSLHGNRENNSSEGAGNQGRTQMAAIIKEHNTIEVDIIMIKGVVINYN